LPAATVADLNAANVRLLYVNWQFTGNVTFYVLGLDGTFRGL